MAAAIDEMDIIIVKDEIYIVGVFAFYFFTRLKLIAEENRLVA